MKLPARFLSLLTASAFLSAPLHAEEVTTDPVGVIKTSVPANSDVKLGVPLLQPSTFTGSVESTDGTVVTLQASPGDVTSEGHFLLVSSGVAEGIWMSVLGANGSDVTLEDAISDLQAGDTVQIRKFWTLGELLPEGGGLPVSSDGLNPVATILLNDPSAVGINSAPTQSFFYHDGSVLAEGWYRSGSAEDAENTVISPETFVTLRNRTDSVAEVVLSGDVPVVKFANEVVSRSAGRQDNLVPNPYPLGMTLGDAGLVSSGAVRESPDGLNPIDTVLLFDPVWSGFNPAPTASYFYHDGSALPEGWYRTGTATQADNVEIPAGGAFIVRRSVGPDAVFVWDPQVPYILN